MDFTTELKPEGLHVSLSGKFTFEDNSRFRKIVELLHNDSLKSLEIDFAGVDFIDSAGLGMLLLLRQECQNHNIALSLHAARGQVKKVFTVSRFDQLFVCPS